MQTRVRMLSRPFPLDLRSLGTPPLPLRVLPLRRGLSMPPVPQRCRGANTYMLANSVCMKQPKNPIRCVARLTEMMMNLDRAR